MSITPSSRSTVEGSDHRHETGQLESFVLNQCQAQWSCSLEKHESFEGESPSYPTGALQAARERPWPSSTAYGTVRYGTECQPQPVHRTEELYSSPDSVWPSRSTKCPNMSAFLQVSAGFLVTTLLPFNTSFLVCFNLNISIHPSLSGERSNWRPNMGSPNLFLVAERGLVIPTGCLNASNRLYITHSFTQRY